jgi:hypothetical protein
MAKIKITYSVYEKNIKKSKTRYAHFNFLYQGSDAVPEPGLIVKKSNLKSTPPTSIKTIYLPEGSTGDSWKLLELHTHFWNTWFGPRLDLTSTYYYEDPFLNYQNNGDRDAYTYIWIPTYGTYETDTKILWANNNSSGKLRKAILISDAFDPENKRNYFSSHVEYDSDNKKFDPRGLYQIFNGDPSAWSKDPGANLASDLRASGYDLVFINYGNGAGDIPENAGRLEKLLDHLNVNYRDNQTEEFVLVGPSMGGIITRYCLTSMESRDKEHHVKLWFSFDSPQEGAYIPLSLQYVMYYLMRRAEQHEKTPAYNMLKDLFNNAIDAPAAKQMLLLHYSTDLAEWGNLSSPDRKSTAVGAKPCSEFNTLYDFLRGKYPKYSKNVAISNGGKKKLYDDSKSQIIKYNPNDWNPSEVIGDRVFNDSESHFLFSGECNDTRDNDYALNFRSNIAFDNAPGGYNTAIYDLNYKSDNEYSFGNDDSNDNYRKSCFIPTVSAFGIKPTQANIYKTHDQIVVSETPFDIIRGTSDGNNEEHVRVSDKTSDWLQNEILKVERKVLQKPYPRIADYTEYVSDASLYTASEEVNLGGIANCSLVLKDKSDVNVVAPIIKLKPGFKIENGAKFYAKSGSVVNGLKSANTVSPIKSLNYLVPSEYENLVYDYSDNIIGELHENITKLADDICVYPNPVMNMFTIARNKGVMEGIVEIRNIQGQLLFSKEVINSKTEKIDVSDLKSGIYFVSLKGCGFFTKIIKK